MYDIIVYSHCSDDLYHPDTNTNTNTNTDHKTPLNSIKSVLTV